MGQNTILKAVETPYPKVNPIQSSKGRRFSIMTNQKLCLKWNDFHDLVQVSFGNFRTDTDFNDVTLACEDQKIRAHKVVLSTCSPFFKKLLETHSHPQPLIYMKGIKASSLKAIIDFLGVGQFSCPG